MVLENSSNSMETLVPIDTVSGKLPEVESGSAVVGDEKPLHRNSRRWRQYLSAVLANLAIVCAGMTMAWTAPALPELKERGMTTEQASWVSACMPLGALVGALPAGAIASRLGRRGALLAFAPVFAIGWMLIALADVDTLWLMYLGRLVQGLTVGPSSVFVPMYSQEISEVAIRGALGSYFDLMMGVGNLVIYILGAFLPYLWYTLSGIAMTGIFIFAFWWMPESPVHLVAKGHLEKARKSLQWLRAPDADIEPELDAMAAAAANPTAGTGVLAALASLRHTNPLRSNTWRALGLVLGLMFFQQACGVNAFLFFTVQIFEDAGSDLTGSECSMITGSVRVASSFLASVMVDRVGRRVLLLVSTVGMTVCLTIFSVYTYLYSRDFNTESWRWVPLAAFLLFLVVYSLGFGPLPYFMMAELLPEQAKGWTASLAVCFSRLWLFILTKNFPVAVESLGQTPVYGTFAFLCFTAFLFVALFVPETKGIPKSEIQKAVGGDRP